jgi:hypothetical protein
VFENIVQLFSEDLNLQRAIRRAKPPKRTIKKDERLSLMNVKNNIVLEILRDHKGGVDMPIVKDHEDYNKKIARIL